MLATDGRKPAMNPRLQQELVASEGPLAGMELLDVQPVAGGCIHQAWRLTLGDGRRLFAKSGGPAAMALFEVEAEALRALHRYADAESIAVPAPLALSALPSGAVLLLPWLELSGGDQASLGRGLALLHQASEADSTDRYGWHRDGYIGAGPQPGGWRDSWGACFVDLRLRPQLERVGDLGLTGPVVERVLEGLRVRLDQLEVAPSLVHGDLWGGNAGVLADQRGSLFDPACWWADREVDLAMTRMFGGFGSRFYDGYFSVLPARPNWDERIEIYNLYHLLNHANLFGGSYRNQSGASLQKLARTLE